MNLILFRKRVRCKFRERTLYHSKYAFKSFLSISLVLVIEKARHINYSILYSQLPCFICCISAGLIQLLEMFSISSFLHLELKFILDYFPVAITLSFGSGDIIMRFCSH